MVNYNILLTLAVAMLMFGIMGIVTSITAQIQGEIKSTQTAASLEQNITNKTMYGIWNVGKQFPLMGTILVFGSIIAIVVAVFLGAIAFKARGRI